MKLKERRYKTKAPLYDWAKLRLVFTNDMHASDKKRAVDDSGAQARTLANGSIIVILLKEKCSVGHVAHEAIHAASYILKHSGIAASLSNDEPLAYLVEWIANWIMKHHGNK